MEQWQDAASQQVKLLTNRVNELLAKGQLWLRSELGVDLGLKPELIPPWVILVAACFGLVLMIALWASACRALFRKHPAAQTVEDSTEVKRGGKPAKPEEQKKKKKKAEKVSPKTHICPANLARLAVMLIFDSWPLVTSFFIYLYRKCADCN